MSAAVDFAAHNFGRHTTLDGMAQRRHGYHDPYNSGHGFYTAQEQQFQQPSEAKRLPRLPPVATMLPKVASSPSPVIPNGRDARYHGGKPTYSFDYATPSPVVQTPPQLPLSNSDSHSFLRRAPDIRRSPTLSSTASDRSSEEMAQRRMSSLCDAPGQSHVPCPYVHQPSPRSSGDSFQHDGILPQVLAAAPPAVPYPSSSTVIPNGRRPVPPQLPRSPPSTQPSTSPRQEPKSMSISNLLSTETNSNSASSPSATATAISTSEQQPFAQQANNAAVPRTPNSGYRISVRQQPFAARSCGFGERDRRVIDPPPIVRLTIHNDELARDEGARRLRHQFSVVHCSIWDERGVKDMSSMPEDFRQQRRLMGTLVASPFVGLDEHGEEGCFFCFPDLSCRTPGLFRLKFALVVLDPARMHTGERSAIVATAMSEVFQVYNAKDFPGMQASTLLTKRLKEQGCLISIKKGNEKREPGSGAVSRGEDEEEEGDDAYDGDGGGSGSGGGPGGNGAGGAGGPKPRVKKRAKR